MEQFCLTMSLLLYCLENNPLQTVWLKVISLWPHNILKMRSKQFYVDCLYTGYVDTFTGHLDFFFSPVCVYPPIPYLTAIDGYQTGCSKI